MSQQINLCNSLFHQQKKYFSAMTMVQSIGLILLGILFFYGYLAYQTRALTAQTRQMTQLYDNAKTQLDTLVRQVNQRQPSPLLVERIAQTEQALHAQMLILNLLQHGELGNQAGFSPYFTALSHQTVTGLWLTGFSITGQADQISLAGRALQPELIAKLIQQLKSETIFSGIQFTTLTIQRPVIADKNAPDNKKATSDHSANSTVPYIEFTLNKATAAQTTTEPSK